VTAAVTSSRLDALVPGGSDPGWSPDSVEMLSEEDAVRLLLRRMRMLVDRGVEVTDALIMASRLHVPIP